MKNLIIALICLISAYSYANEYFILKGTFKDTESYVEVHIYKDVNGEFKHEQSIKFYDEYYIPINTIDSSKYLMLFEYNSKIKTLHLKITEPLEYIIHIGFETDNVGFLYYNHSYEDYDLLVFTREEYLDIINNVEN